jgi:hypothetical protein
MPRLRTHLALAAVLALLGPGAALAQNPGDEQYSDPLAPNEQPGGGGQGGGGGSGSDSGSAEESQADEDTGTESGTRGGSSQLPRTGLPAGVMALLGAGMLASGAALRRRLT